MNHSKLLLSMALAIAPALAQAEAESERGVSVAAELSRPEVIARYEKAAQPKLACSQPESAEAMAQAYQSLASHKWSRSELGCAALYGFQLAQAQPGNVELGFGALVTQIDYLDLLASEYEGLYSGPETSAELRLRWKQARSHGEALIEQLEPLAGKSVEFRTLRATFWMASTVKESSPVESARAAARALPELEAVIAEKPETLGGLPLMLLGRMTFLLPEFAGGDPLRAIELLKQGVAVNPQDMVMRRWLAEVLISERQYPEAREVIKAAISVPANAAEPQAYADEMRAMAGLARRVNDEVMAEQVAQQRSRFLEAHPYLLARRSTASFGHGGADPFTGKEVD
ncbi:tetratricopeptide repeat protein [Aquipseudomonas alcaligenes]|uniref:Tetratricopeptide repeat-containing protein n=1 Tax=Aquipseudomonas alcaligenes TaxID=43263 RepID=A0A1N6NP81_AQUAC|nr:tetratricopeptide repeat protein [Pseudomonas alcaligenes]SIP93891.1 Tetratricopeptide repeat-containing protein [Pseudomonas alcaligenes]